MARMVSNDARSAGSRPNHIPWKTTLVLLAVPLALVGVGGARIAADAAGATQAPAASVAQDVGTACASTSQNAQQATRLKSSWLADPALITSLGSGLPTGTPLDVSTPFFAVNLPPEFDQRVTAYAVTMGCQGVSGIQTADGSQAYVGYDLLFESSELAFGVCLSNSADPLANQPPNSVAQDLGEIAAGSDWHALAYVMADRPGTELWDKAEKLLAQFAPYATLGGASGMVPAVPADTAVTAAG